MTKIPNPSFQSVVGELPKPRITKRGVGIVISLWCVYSLFASVPLMMYYQNSSLQALYWQACQSMVMFVLSIPPWFIVIRWMHSVRWYWKGFVHLLLAPTFAILNFLYLYYMVRWFGGEASAELLKKAAGWLLYFNLLIYLLQFALYHAYEILRQLRTKEKIALELVALRKEQELATLKAQINPHFLFNTLNSISAMASTDAEETRTMIAQLADLLRYAFESSKKDLVLLKEELQFVQDYIALESKRLEDRLTTKFQVDQSLYSYLVPPMILQPLVENAIKHGIAPAEEGGRVCIQIQKETEGITFRISNTGVGISCSDPLATTDGVGLKNTDARIRKIYGDSARLKIQSLDQQGCEVVFTLPLK
ncbi:MAG: histidine kinase [Bacteroidota bacterium]|jgi:sensor histidine kinase YesM